MRARAQKKSYNRCEHFKTNIESDSFSFSKYLLSLIVGHILEPRLKEHSELLDGRGHLHDVCVILLEVYEMGVDECVLDPLVSQHSLHVQDVLGSMILVCGLPVSKGLKRDSFDVGIAESI